MDTAKEMEEIGKVLRMLQALESRHVFVRHPVI